MPGFAREIGAAQATITAITGQVPMYFRPPAGVCSPLLAPVLARLGIPLVTWTRRGFDTVTRDPEKIAIRLLRDLAATDILLLHDGNAARMACGTPAVLAALPRILEGIAARGLKSVTLRDGMR